MGAVGVRLMQQPYQIIIAALMSSPSQMVCWHWYITRIQATGVVVILSLSVFHPIMAVLGLNHSILLDGEGEFSYPAIIAENNTLHVTLLGTEKHCLSAVSSYSIKMWRKGFMKRGLLAALALTMTLGMGNAVAQQLTYPTKKY